MVCYAMASTFIIMKIVQMASVHVEEKLNIISVAIMLMVQYASIVFLVGYGGKHHKTNNCLYEMSPL